MYSTDSIFESSGFVIFAIIQIILLIVFLRMAWNISQIKKYFVKDSPDHLLEDARKMEFKGKKDQAIDLYLDYIYQAQNAQMDSSTRTLRIREGVKAIYKLGGEVPDDLKSYLNN